MVFVDFINFFVQDVLGCFNILLNNDVIEQGDNGYIVYNQMKSSQPITLTALFIPIKNYNIQIPKQNSCKKDNTVIKDITLYANKEGISVDFLNWFVGFTDGEGNFTIEMDGKAAKFRFKILLHIDDIQSLEEIKKKFKCRYCFEICKR